jgi:hypothetical protein
MKSARKPRHRISHEGRLTWLALAAGAPATIIAFAMLWFGNYSAKVDWTLSLIIVTCALGFIASAREHIVRPLQTMSNLLAALREGDYSIRARGARTDDALGEVLLEINQLGETLRVQRLGAFEATALLRTIMAEIDVAVTSIPTAGSAWSIALAKTCCASQSTSCRPPGKGSRPRGLSHADEDQPLTLTFPGAGTPGVQTAPRNTVCHTIARLTDLSRTRGEEHRLATTRQGAGPRDEQLVAPIKSIAGSGHLLRAIHRRPIGATMRGADWM